MELRKHMSVPRGGYIWTHSHPLYMITDNKVSFYNIYALWRFFRANAVCGETCLHMKCLVLGKWRWNCIMQRVQPWMKLSQLSALQHAHEYCSQGAAAGGRKLLSFALRQSIISLMFPLPFPSLPSVAYPLPGCWASISKAIAALIKALVPTFLAFCFLQGINID